MQSAHRISAEPSLQWYYRRYQHMGLVLTWLCMVLRGMYSVSWPQLTAPPLHHLVHPFPALHLYHLRQVLSSF